MVSTKWFQEGDFSEIQGIREEVFINELGLSTFEVSDKYDLFAKKILLYEDKKAVASARLIFKEGRYEIDMVCVLAEHRRKRYADLMIRMLVRKAVEIGANNTIAFCDAEYEELFLKIGFIRISSNNQILLMSKKGDIENHCNH